MPLVAGYYEVTDEDTITALNEAEQDEDGYAFLQEDYAFGCLHRRRRIRFRYIGGHWFYPIPPVQYSQA